MNRTLYPPRCRATPQQTIRRQHGSALIIGLVLLLVVTILAVAGMQDTLLQERMSGNWHDRNLALQASEAALREGEEWLASAANRDAARGHDRLDDLHDPVNWEGQDSHGTVDLTNADVSFAAPAAFYVNPPECVPYMMDPAKPGDWVYPIYSHGVGGTQHARVTLQGWFIPPDSEPEECPDPEE